ncbi:glycosyltransferase family 2 protein [Dyella sp.]|uniref:glycosyltransferase family 2 protein n=1 Tax=Dyella sp. TaxID=1869338 RepID=UPI003217E018
MAMKIQVFIPTFNRADKLRRAVDSVLTQTVPGLELVVLDNHSEDRTAQMLAELSGLDARVRHIRRPQNIGMIPNMNAIRELVDGDYFAMLPDDDVYEPIFLEEALERFRQYPDIDFVACNALTKIGDRIEKSQLDYWREGRCAKGTAVLKCLLGHYPLITNVLFRASLRERFFFHSELGNVADGFVLTNLFASHHGYISKRVSGYWNNDGENASVARAPNPIDIANVALSEYVLYRKEIAAGRLPRGWLPVLALKRNLSILMVSRKIGFDRVRDESRMVTLVPPSMVWWLRALDRTKVIKVVVGTLGFARKCYRRIVAFAH